MKTVMTENIIYNENFRNRNDKWYIVLITLLQRKSNPTKSHNIKKNKLTTFLCLKTF